MIRPVLKKFLDNYKDIAFFTFIGVEPRIREVGYNQNITFLPLMNLNKYTEYMETHAFDVGLAPLETNRFSSMKYFNKYIEYGKTGIAGLYSNMRPYTYVIDNGRNGFLINDDPEEWYEKMRFCVENIDEVRAVGLNAQRDLLVNFSLKSISERFQKHLAVVITDDPHNRIVWKRNLIIEASFSFADLFYKFCFLMKNRGIRETIKYARRKMLRDSRKKQLDERE